MQEASRILVRTAAAHRPLPFHRGALHRAPGHGRPPLGVPGPPAGARAFPVGIAGDAPPLPSPSGHEPFRRTAPEHPRFRPLVPPAEEREERLPVGDVHPRRFPDRRDRFLHARPETGGGPDPAGSAGHRRPEDGRRKARPGAGRLRGEDRRDPGGERGAAAAVGVLLRPGLRGQLHLDGVGRPSAGGRAPPIIGSGVARTLRVAEGDFIPIRAVAGTPTLSPGPEGAPVRVGAGARRPDPPVGGRPAGAVRLSPRIRHRPGPDRREPRASGRPSPPRSRRNSPTPGRSSTARSSGPTTPSSTGGAG